MMPGVLLEAKLPFGTAAERRASEAVLTLMLGVVSTIDRQYLLAHAETPMLYESGVRYALPDQLTAHQPTRRQMKRILQTLKDANVPDETVTGIVRMVLGQEVFRDIPTILGRGESDCNDLVCWRVAELWNAGIPASPRIADSEDQPNAYHATVRWPDGSIEDPSLLLGMYWPETAAARTAEIAKNYARRDAITGMLARHFQSPGRLESAVHLFGLAPRAGFPEELR